MPKLNVAVLLAGKTPATNAHDACNPGIDQRLKELVQRMVGQAHDQEGLQLLPAAVVRQGIQGA